MSPPIRQTSDVLRPVPEMDGTLCTFCDICGKTCRYCAILVLPKEVMILPKLCHGCGGCSLA